MKSIFKEINSIRALIKSHYYKRNSQFLQSSVVKTSKKQQANFSVTRKVIKNYKIVKSTSYLHDLASKTSLLETGTDSFFY